MTGAIRILATVLFALIVCAACGVDAQAKRGLHHHHVWKQALHRPAEPDAYSQQTVVHGTMRYYGGPKSPMWRG